MSCSAFLYKPGPCPGLVLFYVICYISSQIKKMFHRQASRPISLLELTPQLRVPFPKRHWFILRWQRPTSTLDETTRAWSPWGVESELLQAAGQAGLYSEIDYLKRKNKQGLGRRLSSLEDPGLIFSTHIGQFITPYIVSSRESSMCT